jgi:hypothetical protein
MRKELLIGLLVLSVCLVAFIGRGTFYPPNTMEYVGDIILNGTFTATNYDSPADTDEGQCVPLRECEGGSGCDTAGNGEIAKICLPDNANPIKDGVTKRFEPGYTFTVWLNDPSIAAAEAGLYCAGSTGQLDTLCTDANQVVGQGLPFTDGVSIETCVLYWGDIGGWLGAADLLEVQWVVYEMDVAGTSFQRVGTLEADLTFVRATVGGDCSGHGTNCMDEEGAAVWDVSGASTATEGIVLLETTADTNDVDDNANARIKFFCKAT